MNTPVLDEFVRMTRTEEHMRIAPPPSMGTIVMVALVSLFALMGLIFFLEAMFLY